MGVCVEIKVGVGVGCGVGVEVGRGVGETVGIAVVKGVGVGVGKGVVSSLQSKAAQASILPKFHKVPVPEIFFAESSIFSLIWPFVQSGFSEATKAASPVTCGDAIDVPERNS